MDSTITKKIKQTEIEKVKTENIFEKTIKRLLETPPKKKSKKSDKDKCKTKQD